MFKQTALTSVDSYKLAHADMFPEGTTKVYSNFTPRSDHYFNVPTEYKDGKVVWFGMQAFLQEMDDIWNWTFFNQEWEEVENEFASFVVPFAGPNGFNMDRVRALHDLGYLPLHFKALPEATLVPIGVPVMTVTNTHPDFFWLPNFMETWLSTELWKSTTSATTARAYRRICEKYAALTGGAKEFIDIQCHDFSVRGMSGIADAAKSGAGHLLSFIGTDNLPAVKLVNDVYYGKETFVGCSVPASEHSVTTSSILAKGNGATNESETEFFRRMVTEVYPKGIVSLVSDSFDFWSVITKTAAELKNEILNREVDGLGLAKVVFRPDSGDPVRIICGDDIPTLEADSLGSAKVWALDWIVDEVRDNTPHGECGESYCDKIFKYDGKYYNASVEIFWNRYDKQYYYEDGSELISFKEVELSPEQKGAVECLFDIFGGTTNDKGFRTLNERVGLIYGDSITPQRAEEILKRLQDKGFASDNIVFGIGSYTYNMVSRDTLGFAMKATYVEVDGQPVAVFKDPKTSDGTKKSAKGLLRVDWGKTDSFQSNCRYILRNDISQFDETGGMLETVYKDGQMLNAEKFARLRERLKNA